MEIALWEQANRGKNNFCGWIVNKKSRFQSKVIDINCLMIGSQATFNPGHRRVLVEPLSAWMVRIL
jgi:hypothetical protein